MGIFPNGIRLRDLDAGGIFFKQIQKLGAGHLAQHGRGQGAGQAVVVDVDIKPVHHVVVRVGKKLFHGGITHVGRDVWRNKAGKAVVGLERFDICQRQGRCGFAPRIRRCRRVDWRQRLDYWTVGQICRPRRWRRRGLLRHRLCRRFAVAHRLFALRPAPQKTVSHANRLVRPVHRRQVA